MKKNRVPFTLFVLFALLGLGLLGPAAYARSAPAAPGPAALAATQACSAGLSGTVVGSDTDLPLAGVTVSASLVDADFSASTTTDAAGHYSLAGLPAGVYQVEFVPDPATQAEYLSEFFSAPGSGLLTLAVGATVPNVNAALDLGGTISGRVIGADSGLGLSGVLVAIAIGDDEPIDQVTTDDNGEYVSDALPSGRYKVSFVPPDDGPAYLPALYAQPAGGQPTLVSVVAPEQTPNIDATLSLGGQIRGRVTAAGTISGLANVSVEVYTSAGDFVTSALTDADGYYATYGLRAGSYKLLFDPSVSDSANAYLPIYYNQRPDLSSGDNVAVAVPYPTTANIALSKGGQFTGSVTAGAGPGLPDVEVRVYSGAGELVTTARTDVSGLYTTPGLAPGSYKLLFKPLGASAAGYAFEYYSNRATLAGADLLAAPSPGVQTQINAVLAGGGTIGGSLSLDGLDLCGAALTSAGATVTIYDADGRAVAFVQPEPDGSYRTPALPAGTYRVGFEGPDTLGLGFLSEFYDNQPSLALAQPIVVSGGAVPNIDATLEQTKLFLPLIRR